MEARRRLALLSSHLHPTIASSEEEKPTSQRLSAVNCASSSECEKGNRESDCVFCRIIRGESPAVKVVVFFIPNLISEFDCLAC
ncbi:hypothetical protein Acr_13g0008190 [Actinidia rufa]|uniref:Uncharacterized protein n=1 Tax=Actinidia rufa TaxID=165716 RepID=A0A7J0FL17_9ERIC|nr:hypothetical protein Acr_13g0008190 [Actinidia rufa]